MFIIFFSLNVIFNLGSYCPAGVGAPYPCPAGSFCGTGYGAPARCWNHDYYARYCPAATQTLNLCPDGFFCVLGTPAAIPWPWLDLRSLRAA